MKKSLKSKSPAANRRFVHEDISSDKAKLLVGNETNAH